MTNPRSWISPPEPAQPECGLIALEIAPKASTASRGLFEMAQLASVEPNESASVAAIEHSFSWPAVDVGFHALLTLRTVPPCSQCRRVDWSTRVLESAVCLASFPQHFAESLHLQQKSMTGGTGGDGGFVQQGINQRDIARGTHTRDLFAQKNHSVETEASGQVMHGTAMVASEPCLPSRRSERCSAVVAGVSLSHRISRYLLRETGSEDQTPSESRSAGTPNCEKDRTGFRC